MLHEVLTDTFKILHNERSHTSMGNSYLSMKVADPKQRTDTKCCDKSWLLVGWLLERKLQVLLFPCRKFNKEAMSAA